MAQVAPVHILTDAEMCDYEYSQEELEEYAQHIGIDTEKDRDLFWIAVEGLTAVPPAPWKACQSEGETEVFFFNTQTGESVWDHPCDEYFRARVQEEMAKRVIVPVTLRLECDSTGSATVMGTNLAGNCVCSAASDSVDTLFGDVLDQLLESLQVPEGTVPRFFSRSCEMLAHSQRGQRLVDVFA